MELFKNKRKSNKRLKKKWVSFDSDIMKRSFFKKKENTQRRTLSDKKTNIFFN